MTSPRKWPLWTSTGAAVTGLLAGALGAALIVLGFSVHALPSAAMTPTLERGSRVITEKVRDSDVRRGDIVLVDSPWDMRGLVVKRVIGIAGDRVACCVDGHVTLNGQPLTEPYLHGGDADGFSRAYSAIVPEGRLFLLGDHRADSVDSRLYLEREAGSIAVTTVRERVVWHDGADSGPLPGKLLGPLTVLAGGGLLAVAGLVATVVTATLAARRRRRTAPAA
ncbi:signal peptidase I [Kitasatospora sp. NBC_01560]|uniref:signal peptidase I n=1 Tax=Kitasatospora sp. NBC_01560 TaxID=2975965 RepID=UPI0038664442